MNFKILAISLAAGGALAGGGYGLYWMGIQHGMGMTTAMRDTATETEDPSTWTLGQGEEATRRHIKDSLKAGDIDPMTGRKILYYHDPMVPGKKFEAPGKSPFMSMMLVPAYVSSENTDTGTVTISPRLQQNIGIRTAPAVEGSLAPAISAVGTIAWNERDQAIVQARAMGYVEKLHVRATLDRVTENQPLVDIYVPDWIAAQEEFLSVQRMQGRDLAPLIEGTKARMRQAGMSEEQIHLVESSGRIQPRITIATPIGGVVTELNAREGMTVMPGMTLFRLNGTGTVWANAEVPESQAALLRIGAKVTATSPAVPGTRFKGHIQALLPEVNPETRTLKARLELANPSGRLIPGMFMQMDFTGLGEKKTLLIPTEAVIQTGKRAVVMVAEKSGRFRPLEVETGIESGDQTEIKRGLQPGQRVVLSGQFLIDSEASLKGLETRLNTPVPAEIDNKHRTEARIEAIDDDTVTLTHPPIESLKWPAMTMDFRLPPADQSSQRLKAGEQVAIEFRLQEGDTPQILSIRPMTSIETNTAGKQK